jgi:hypothetical protein
MKKQITTSPLAWLGLSLVFLLGLPQLNAQTIEYGARAGVNFAYLFGDTYSGLGIKPGIVLGGFARSQFNDQVSLQVGAYLSQEGARNPNFDFSDFSTVIYDQRLQYIYLQIPLLVRYHYTEKLNFHGGMQMGLRLLAQEKRRIVSGMPSITDNSEGIRKQHHRVKLFYPSFVVGAGYELTDQISAQARFIFSFFDNIKRNAGDSEGTYPLILQLSVSYALGELDL